MKKILIGSSMLVVFFAACKKSDDSSSSLVGTWSKTHDAVDNNNNGVLDESEKTAIAAGNYEYATYRSNGTVTDSTAAMTLDATWAVSGNYLTITIPGFGAVTGKYSITGSTLVLEDTSSHPLEWSIYAKQ